jgi:pimeloyl-ACP methyl ester carboxylesterase
MPALFAGDKTMSIYPNSAVQEEMIRIYDGKLASWPVPYEPLEIGTSFGSTHVIAFGRKDAPVLMLIPGLGVTSMMWLPNAVAFSRYFHCYAVDVIGDYGRSRLADPRRYPHSGRDYSCWLKEVSSELGTEKAHYLAASHGGFAAIHQAIHAPERVGKLILIAPSGLVLTLRKVLPKIFHYLIFPSDANREALVNWFLGESPAVGEAFHRQLQLGLLGRPKVPIPILISTRQLRRIEAPVMFILGERDPAVPAASASRRVAKALPQARVEVIPSAGHAMNIETRQ